jgi:hypothetical protein
MKNGQGAQINVEELKLEPGRVPTLLQLMVVHIVLGKVLRLSPVIFVLVQVNTVFFSFVQENRTCHARGIERSRILAGPM